MDKLRFSKYHGTGNDFIMVDDRDERFDYGREIIALLCNRRLGIGADGLILLRKHKELDFRMVYYNSDGRESSMCGNGGRCIAAFAAELKLAGVGQLLRFEAADGYHEAVLTDAIRDGYHVDLKMKDVSEIETTGEAVIMNTGSPHYIKASENLDELKLVDEARLIRYSSPFNENGINVNFIEAVGDGIRVRTYERGVEDETYSCGTGVVASAIAAQFLFPGNPVNSIITKGGTLSVSFEKTESRYQNIHLIGPALKTFDGIFSGSL